MPVSLSTRFPDRPSGPDSLLRVLGLAFRWSLWNWMVVGLLSALVGWMGLQVEKWNLIPLVCLSLFPFFQMRVVSFAQSSRWLLPLGDRRTAVLLWFCQVPMVSFQATLACAPLYLWRSGPSVNGLLNYAQYGLWAAGVLALLSTSRSLAAASRRHSLWMTAVGVLSVLFLCFPPACVSSAIASGRYDMILNFLSAAMMAFSFWALCLNGREDGLLNAPLTEQAAAQYLDFQAGWGARVLCLLSGGMLLERFSGHWLPQLFVRFFLSLASVFVLNLLLHYGIAPRTPVEAFYFSPLLLPALTHADPRMLRRLPLGTFGLTALTVLLIALAAGLLTLSPLAFERVPGSFSVRFTLAQIASLHTLGAVAASAGQIMVGWAIFMASPLSRGEFTGRTVIACLVFLIIPAGILAGLQPDWGWRADLAIGGALLLGGAIVYYLMLYRGTLLYKPANKGRRLTF